MLIRQNGFAVLDRPSHDSVRIGADSRQSIAGLRFLGVWCLLAVIPVGVAVGAEQRLEASDQPCRPRVIAHRGAMSERPENTVIAVRRAIEVGADAVEIDVRTSRDGILFLMHDKTLDRTTNGKGPASALTISELKRLDAGSYFGPEYKGTAIATLAEVLEECRNKIDVLLDLKEAGQQYAEAVAEVARRHGDLDRIVLGVHSVKQAEAFRRLLPHTRQLAFLADPEEIEAFAEAGTETIRIWPRWIDPSREPGVVQRVRHCGARLQLNGTSGTVQDLLPLLEHRPDDLLVNDPLQARKTLAQWLQYQPAMRRLRERVEFLPGGTVVPWVSKKGTPTFLNRDYRMLQLPDELSGRGRVMFAGGEGDRVRIRFTQPAVVFAALQYNQTGAWSFPEGRSPREFGWRVVAAQAYRGTSNGNLGGGAHFADIYCRRFDAGDTLDEMPPWWLCLAMVSPEQAERVPGYRKAMSSPDPPPVPFLYGRWATRRRPLNVPPFESREQWEDWQRRRRSEFRRRLVFHYDHPAKIVSAGEPVRKSGFTQQEFHVLADGRLLFRFFRLVPRAASRSGFGGKLPTIVCFMGHGKVRQILSERDSYQHACAARFAERGYLVYAMENVGMEPERDRHLELDRILRLDGYGWYSLLFAHQQMLLDHVFSDPLVDASNVGVTGVSTGGLLALSAAAMDVRVKAASVQGIFGSMRESFIKDRNRHCQCGAIPGLLPKFDLPELALLVAPRPLHISNAERDGFTPKEAGRCVEQIADLYLRIGGNKPRFTSPPGNHEFAWEEAVRFFEEVMSRPAREPSPAGSSSRR